MNRSGSRGQQWGAAGVILLSCALSVVWLGGCPITLPPADGDPNDANDTVVGNSAVTGPYAGSERCGLCHVNTHTNWGNTLHAGALKTLEDIGQANNDACLPCHVVGFGEEGGFVDRATTNALADVGCESCHGPSLDHVNNVVDKSLRPNVSIASEVCGTCHTGSHHPHITEWQESGHAAVTGATANYFQGGNFGLNACGECHSGDYFHLAILNGEDVEESLLQGVAPENMMAVECAICHDPHMQTGKAAEPDEGRDFQLRYAEVTNPTPTNTEAAVQDTSRFNLCGQCHHSRGRMWTSTDRGPHHSVQVNVYTGEMATPAGESPLIFSRVSVHSFAPEQCATCHMFRQDFESEIAPAISGHTFAVNFKSCAISGCHPSQAQAEAVYATLQAEIQGRLDAVAAALGDPATWEYSEEGGPSDQSGISDNVKKARFLYHMVLSDGSLGMHNPSYVRDMLLEAEELLAN